MTFIASPHDPPDLADEVRRLSEDLARHRPETLGLASRISGITPASISLLMVHLKKGGLRGFGTLSS